MRGKEQVRHHWRVPPGITPACAGKSTAESRLRITTGDHPRVCGEKFCACATGARARGSPPRVRGKALGNLFVHHHQGITPACAGKSKSFFVFNEEWRDHPRVCGEKVVPCSTGLHVQGSPPRVRGKADNDNQAITIEGITPACAGKSLSALRNAYADGDHPRVCGEKQTRRSTGHVKPGSPPRVRGKGFPVCSEKRASGITPACAGKRE